MSSYTPIKKAEFQQLLTALQFKEIFGELGWTFDRTAQPVTIGNVLYEFRSVAQKNGFRVLVHTCPEGQALPTHSTRKALAQYFIKPGIKCLMIYHNGNDQIWEYTSDLPNQPRRTHSTHWNPTKNIDLLYQRVSRLFFTIDEYEHTTISTVEDRVKDAFSRNAEKVTKQFYDAFKKQHTAFLQFITGISEQIHQEWYASLMLNRLMFCYFIQKKGFLDSDPDYLSNRLKFLQERESTNKFYSFYREFLLVLFHNGLGNSQRSEATAELLGNIPYLNGGLFDVHELEIKYTDIQIPDAAFSSLFSFFDKWEWHLDTRLEATGKEINPDIIGYIFEKYINDRAQMGAYYTKEDITEYIAKNCIIPYLLDEVKRQYPAALDATGEFWTFVRQSSDAYIYDAVKYGLDQPLPSNIKDGIDTSLPNLAERRKDWNKPTDSGWALPTEIWRETVERYQRYRNLKNRIEQGDIQTIQDLITYNMNIRQLLSDFIEQTNDAKFLTLFYAALERVTVLDPTCGSGAFLFAALNILEPLYEVCIDRMEEFLNDEDAYNLSDERKATNKQRANAYPTFRTVLAKITAHQDNKKYFIYKSIILNNLYGVDIMREATEIAKLRLFLKLVSVVEADPSKDNYGLDPLPDVDFNIRSGNTLIGFANFQELLAVFNTTTGFGKEEHVRDLLEFVKQAYIRFKELQLDPEKERAAFQGFKETKQLLLNKLEELNNFLDEFLHDQHYTAINFNEWRKTHQPFHWIAAFYEIIVEKKGFDVIIGNPPYVEYSTIKKNYIIKNITNIVAGNLYAFVIERTIVLQKIGSYNGMIIPISAYCTDRMDTFQKMELRNTNALFVSFYAERPSKLFEGAERNLAIAIFKKELVDSKHIPNVYTTYYYKWNSASRQNLFSLVNYINSNSTITNGVVPKISCKPEINIINTLHKIKRNIGYYALKTKSNHVLYYRNSGGRYWKITTNFQPQFLLNGEKNISSRESYLYFSSNDTLLVMIALLNSSLYYWYYIMNSDARTNNPSDLKNFPIVLEDLDTTKFTQLKSLAVELMRNVQQNAVMQHGKYKTGNVIFQQFYPALSKPIIDQIDAVLAEHYGFTEEELDFIVNYDIKYRMGKSNDEEEE